MPENYFRLTYDSDPDGEHDENSLVEEIDCTIEVKNDVDEAV
jgi:hypothetical protein